MAKGRPGGNPDLEKHQFTTDKKEGDRLKKHIQLRISENMANQLEKLPNKQEFIREAIKEKLERDFPEK